MAPPAKEPIAMPSLDRGRLNLHERVSPPRPHSSQDQPEQMIRCAKPPIRTGEYAQLMAQGKTLEQQVATRREGESDCSDYPDQGAQRVNL
jgi:hypothetical protein